jgi:NADH-quinone oxidoreductase subunit H
MDFLWQLFWALIKTIGLAAAVMAIAAYLVLFERKVCSLIQGRLGPNRVKLPILGDIPFLGRFLTRLGIFQPLADIPKLIFKEEIIPGHVKKFFFMLAPCLAFIPAYTTMVVIPFGQFSGAPLILADIDLGAFFIMAVAGMGVYGLVLAGWSSNSKYPYLGSIRAAAQLISYELSMVVALLSVGLWTGSFSLTKIVALQAHSAWLILLQPLSAFIFLVALFAETNRAPFDMPEAEAELAGGYNVEYGALKFGMFFVGEYTNMIIGSAVFVNLFLGGWTWPGVVYPAGWLGCLLSLMVFFAKLAAMLFLFVWVRWTFPRFRYDQVMKLGWGTLLPLALANLVLNAILAGYSR